jgi:hypothetical protein
MLDHADVEKTSVSVPRLTPVCSVRTSTSSRAGAGTRSGRISPRPGSASQKARASPVMSISSSLVNRSPPGRV